MARRDDVADLEEFGRFAEPALLILVSLAAAPSTVTQSLKTSPTSRASASGRDRCTAPSPGSNRVASSRRSRRKTARSVPANGGR